MSEEILRLIDRVVSLSHAVDVLDPDFFVVKGQRMPINRLTAILMSFHLAEDVLNGVVSRKKGGGK